MNRNLQIICISIFVMTLGCATPQKGALAGAAIGGGAGLALSSQGGKTNEQRATGLAIGALLGGAIGYLASKEKLKKEKPYSSSPEEMADAPRLRRPEVRRIWVRERIVGDEYVSGHWKYLIQKNAVWTKGDRDERRKDKKEKN